MADELYTHECLEWDGLVINKHDVEFESCLCYNPRPYSPIRSKLIEDYYKSLEVK